MQCAVVKRKLALMDTPTRPSIRLLLLRRASIRLGNGILKMVDITHYACLQALCSAAIKTRSCDLHGVLKPEDLNISCSVGDGFELWKKYSIKPKWCNSCWLCPLSFILRLEKAQTSFTASSNWHYAAFVPHVTRPCWHQHGISRHRSPGTALPNPSAPVVAQ